MIIDGGITLPEREAVERFRLRERLQRYHDRAPERMTRHVCVVEGDYRYQGNLELDLERFDHLGLIVDGNLEVDGSVLVTWNLGGPFLHVSGNLRAKNVVAGDGEIHVEGDADIDGLLLGIGNDGHLSIDGATRAALIIREDHSMDMKTASPYWYDRAWPSGMPLSEYLHRDVPVERNDDGFEVADSELLIERIRAGQPVVRDADDPRPRKTYAQWLADCGESGRALEYVPRELIDPALCTTAVGSWGHALQYVPRELVTEELCDLALAGDPYALQHVPAELRTPERCRVAVEHDGDLLFDVPVPLRTEELCAKALETARSIQAIRAVPEDVFTPELALHAVRNYHGNLHNVPERFRTREVCIAALSVNPFLIDEVPESLREELRERYQRGGAKP
ncbi:MAG TPA: DUF4116 domain-containing protein [Thermoanaerobaculia bacterium]